MTLDERWLLEEKYDGEASAAFEEDCGRLAAGEPAAYVIGWQPFLGLRIFLDSRPLIPRPETEWWAEQLLSFLGEYGGALGEPIEERAQRAITFLDLCAGSGAIGCAALARLPHARVYFGELDPAHEATIRKNIRENGLDETRADIRIGDLFAPFPAGARFDVIAANPPYIPDERRLPESVADWEPELALRAGSDGLSLIRRIAAELPARLAEDGMTWIECDCRSVEAARELFAEQGFDTEIRTDQYSVPRVIVCKHPRARSAQ